MQQKQDNASEDDARLFSFPEKGGFLLPFGMNDIHCAQNQHILHQCSLHLHQGHLVAFPTETVYGLGANALSEQAVLSIFLAKKRPLTDPVIVHVLGIDDALPLVDLSESVHLELVYRHLANSFWPGPLTLVAKANAKLIPTCVTAGTGFVGIRSPKHPVARSLIAVSKLPIAAPSANRFGHVSPTLAAHVMEDLGDSPFPIAIMDVGQECCHVGIESTVAKLEIVMEPMGSVDTLLEQQQEEEQVDKRAQPLTVPTVYITVLRKGGISVQQIEASARQLLAELAISGNQQQPEVSKFCIHVQTLVKKVSNNTTIGQSAPGQMITHYAPDIPAFLYRVNETTQQCSPKEVNATPPLAIALKDVVIIDMGGQLAKWKHCVLQYFCLSASGNIQEASSQLFGLLRQSEKVEGAKAVLLANVQPWIGGGEGESSGHQGVEQADALLDRMFRSASGRYASVQEDNSTLIVHSPRKPSNQDSAND